MKTIVTQKTIRIIGQKAQANGVLSHKKLPTWRNKVFLSEIQHSIWKLKPRIAEVFSLLDFKLLSITMSSKQTAWLGLFLFALAKPQKLLNYVGGLCLRPLWSRLKRLQLIFLSLPLFCSRIEWRSYHRNGIYNFLNAPEKSWLHAFPREEPCF